MRLSTRIILKRIIDTAVVVLASPVALVVGGATAVCVRMSMGTPVLYRQTRIGLHEHAFQLLKFRTMQDIYDEDGRPLGDRDRLTRVGRFLRSTSLDELPQLLNILRGEMSLVGPRPLLPEYLPFYRESERARHFMRPGITGEAQTAGRNGLLWDERLKIDAQYVLNRSLVDDLRILTKTLVSVFKRSGVSVIAGDTGEPLNIARGYPANNGRTMRRLETADAKLRVEWFSDARVYTTMNVPRDISIDGTVSWILQAREDSGYRDFVLVDNQHGQVLAMMGTRGGLSSDAVEIYIVVDPELHNQGVGTSAMNILLSHLRTQSKLDGAWLTVSPDNAAAIALYERVGFKRIAADSHGDQAARSRVRMEIWWGE